MMTNRREFLAATALAVSLACAAERKFRYAICNETFEGQSLAEACRVALSTGYQGIEIAPGTLAADPATLTSSQTREIRRTIESSGIKFAGLHSLVSTPAGLHLTTPDANVRNRSWTFFRRLVDLCAELGPHGVMVLGSGKQRGAVDGSSVEDARKRLTEGLASVAQQAADRGVLILLEPLSPQFTNVVNTLGEAVDVVRQVGSPAVSSMFDTHNTVAETAPHDQVIRRYSKHIRHLHINELDGRHPGTGNYNFGLVLSTLRDIGYDGWVSLEVFQFKPDGETIAKETMAVLKRLEQRSGRA